LPARRFVQVLFAVLALAFVSGAGATGTPTNGRIAYASMKFGYPALYSVAPDGSTPRRLTFTDAQEQAPAWSPDGNKIAYERRATGNDSRFRIWVMNADGGGQRQLSPDTDATDHDVNPAWSPDGTQIAFASSRAGNLTFGIWVMTADGTGLHQVGSSAGFKPSWSPDGSRLAYAGQGGVEIVNADGTDAHVITGPGKSVSDPAWSPDGSRILFTATTNIGMGGEIYLVNTDGSNELRLTTSGFDKVRPAWSPDGTRIVFTRIDASNASDLWTIDADGSGEQQLTFGAHALDADWGTSQLLPNDLESPIIDIRSPVSGAVYMAGSSQTAFYSCSGQVAQLRSCTGDVPHGSSFDLSPGSHTFTVRAVDSLGNSATKTVTYEVIGIDLRTPADGATYDLDQNLTVEYSCTGGVVVRCEGSAPNGTKVDTSYGGAHRFTVVAFDNTGRSYERTATYTVIDLRPPTIEIATPVAGWYPVGWTFATVYYRCLSPAGVRIVSCEGTLPNGAVMDMSSVGPHDFTVNAVDANGRSTSTTLTYHVVYVFEGFDSPVDASGTIGAARAGDGIALKFSLQGDQGLNVVTRTTWQTASCVDWTPIGTTANAEAKLSYNTSTDRYRDVVATSSNWKGMCRILRLDFADSISREVSVRFKN
jgi:dipeptidyl aminopeptidase/acylaminoacyl peptidase